MTFWDFLDHNAVYAFGTIVIVAISAASVSSDWAAAWRDRRWDISISGQPADEED